MRINTLALVARLPTMHGTRTYVEAGGLMSYVGRHADAGVGYRELDRVSAEDSIRFHRGRLA